MQSRPMRWEKLVEGLAWLGMTLGAAELLAPGTLARVVNRPRRLRLWQSLGPRELGIGFGVLLLTRAARGPIGRVAGDLADMSIIGASLFTAHAPKVRMAAGAAAMASIVAMEKRSRR